jgi:hypothetical protein
MPSDSNSAQSSTGIWSRGPTNPKFRHPTLSGTVTWLVRSGEPSSVDCVRWPSCCPVERNGDYKRWFGVDMTYISYDNASLLKVQWCMLQRTILQRTDFINEIKMLQRTRRNTIGRRSTRLRMACRAFPLWLERQSSFLLSFVRFSYQFSSVICLFVQRIKFK